MGRKEEYFSQEKRLSSSFFQDCSLDGLAADNFILEPSKKMKIDIVVAVAFGVVLNPSDNFNILRKAGRVAGKTVQGGATAIGAGVMAAGFIPELLPIAGAIGYAVGFLGTASILALPALGLLATIAFLRGSNAAAVLQYETSFVETYEKTLTDEVKKGDLLNREEDLLFQLSSKKNNLAKDYLRHAVTLRKFVMERCSFHIGIVGQPGSGKSTFISQKAKVFHNAPKYVQITTNPQQFRCSDKVNVTDFPGMGGTDEFSGARMSLFQNAVDTLDVVLLFVKAMDRSYLAVADLVKITGEIPIYVGITHVDEAIRSIMDNKQINEADSDDDDDDDDDEMDDHNSLEALEAKWYDEAIQELKVWHLNFCHRNKIGIENVNFIFPSKRIEKIATSGRSGNNRIKVGGSSMIKNVNHLVSWLQDKAVKCTTLTEDEISEVIKAQK